MIRLGIAGMGIRGKLYANAIKQYPKAQLVSVSEPVQVTLDQCTEKFDVKGYKDYKEMIEQEDLDAIIVATPDFAHCDIAIRAAEKGIHLLVEKPFATSSDEAKAMLEVVEKSRVKCMVGFENRWNMPFVSIKDAVGQGEIGHIITMNARLNDTIYVPTKMLSWAAETTPAWFLLSHLIDMSCWLTGKKVINAQATGIKEKLVSLGIDTYDSIIAMLTFEDGTIGSYTTSWVLPECMPMIYDLKYEIIGTEGCFYVDLQDQMVHEGGKLYKHRHTLGTPVAGRLTAAPELMLYEFLDNLIDDIYPAADAYAGYVNTLIIEAIHQSIHRGGPVNIEYK
ncbi:MAG: Gfo/Idh/MocA family protein [Caldicoprobacterales bacterium]|mgnify:CR=1 FL=1|jgi:predicted dehydrogenase|nr:Gfo/Idh/MocA family oxidoreductase [Clostridiales bacterium]